MYAGVDLSLTATGLTLYWSQAKFRTEVLHTETTGLERLARLRHLLIDTILTVGRFEILKGIAIEGYSYNSKGRVHSSAEWGGVARLALRDTYPMCPIIEVPPQTLKKYVLGSGGGKKNEMLLGVYKKWGHTFRDDNEADSYALSSMAYSYFAQPGDLHKYEMECINACHLLYDPPKTRRRRKNF